MNIKVADFGLSNKFISHKWNIYCDSPTLCCPRTLPVPKLRWHHSGYVEPGNCSVFHGHWILPFVGEDFSGSCGSICCWLLLLSFECESLLQKLMILNPSSRETVEEIMKDLWINMGQEDELRPYSEPPCDEKGPRVIDIMITMHFEWDQT